MCPLAGRAWFETPSGGIPAASGGTDGKATCDLLVTSIDGSGDATRSGSLDETSTQITHTVYNAGAAAVAGSIETQCLLIDGVWVANWEDCG